MKRTKSEILLTVQLADDPEIPAPEIEYLFHERRKWRFDFAWPAQKMAVEIEGGTWIQGRHTRGAGFQDDCEKYAEALLLGWRVLRVPTDWVTSGIALHYTARMLGSHIEKRGG